MGEEKNPIKPRNNFRFFRIFIYLSGLSVVIFFIAINIFEKNIELFSFKGEVTALQIPTRDSSKKITADIFLKDENVEQEKIKSKNFKNLPGDTQKKRLKNNR